jgi:hypothetical protein
MEFETSEITVYEYRWGRRLCGFALTRDSAVEGVQNHYLYGERENTEADCFLGTKWAESNDGDGWWIEPKTVFAVKLPGNLKGNFAEGETAHLIWQCPHCGEYYSDDADEETASPQLVCCSCSRVKKYYLVEF